MATDRTVTPGGSWLGRWFRLWSALRSSPRLFAFLLGGVCVFGFAPFDQFGATAVPPAPTLVCISLGGLFLLWRDASVRQAAERGLAWGAGFFLGGVSWIYVSLSQFSGMAPPLAALATLLFCLYLALFPALAGAAFAYFRSSRNHDIALFGGLWMLSEWLRGTLFTGFPWLAVGYSQSPPSPLAGFAPILGVYGVGFLVALCSAGLASALVNKEHRRITAIALLTVLSMGWLLRGIEWTSPVGKPLSVSLLQGNVPQSVKWDPQRLWLSVDRYVSLAQRNPATLTVLPETALPLFFSEVPQEMLDDLTRHGQVILGIPIGTRGGGYSNGAVLLPAQRTASEESRPAEKAIDKALPAYAKRHLVPFGEFTPPGFDWFFRLAQIPFSSFTAGATRQPAFLVGEQRIAANICYEDLFGEELLTGLNEATLLLNLSNTAWFGDSLAQPQHLQIARLRALETGRVMLRATNTGMTAMILPNGQVAAMLTPFSAGALTVSAQGYQGLTPYARWGNLFALLLAVIAIIACLPAWRARRLQWSGRPTR